MKPNLWVEFPCKKYKNSYGIKIWESGGSWLRPTKWYVKSQGSYKQRAVYDSSEEQTGGFSPALCAPCVSAGVTSLATTTGAVAGTLGISGVVGYNISKRSKKSKTKKKTKKKGK